MFLKIKCPCCNRHLDEVEAVTAKILRKCKSCKNNIITTIDNNLVVKNEISHLSNNKEILHRYTGTQRSR